MYNKIQVDVDTFNNVREKVLDGFTFKKNFRKPVNEGTSTMAGYNVIKHIDTSSK